MELTFLYKQITFSYKNCLRILKCVACNVELHCTKNEVFHQGFLKEMSPKSQETTDLVTFTEAILNGKTQFFVQCTKPDLLNVQTRRTEMK